MTVHCPFSYYFGVSKLNLYFIKGYIFSKNSLKENEFFSVKFAVLNKYLIMTTSINMKIINFGTYNKFFFSFIFHNNFPFSYGKTKTRRFSAVF